MCKVVIEKWYGRFGNNMMQIANCCMFAFETNSARIIEFPYHKTLTSKCIINDKKNACKCDKILSKEIFFKSGNTWYDKRNIIQKYALGILPNKITHDSSQLMYDCCVHVRSGDTKNVTNGNYAKLPVEYYICNIDKQLFNNLKVHIIFEDKNIDVFKKITEKYQTDSRVSFTCGTTLEEDMNTLSRCKHLIVSVGTFNMISVCLSKTIEHVYLSNQRKINETKSFTKTNSTLLQNGTEIQMHFS